MLRKKSDLAENVGDRERTESHVAPQPRVGGDGGTLKEKRMHSRRTPSRNSGILIRCARVGAPP